MCTAGPLSLPLQLGLRSELVLYTLAQLTPVTACDQQQVLPILRSALTNHSPVLPETDQSGARTAVLYIWVPYGHASHRMILATFILSWWMSSKGLSNKARVLAHWIIEAAQVMLFWKLGLVNILFIAKIKQEQLHQYFKILVSSHSLLLGTNQHQQLHLLKIVFLLFSSSLLYLLYLSNLVDISQIYTYCWIFDKPTWYHCRNPMDMVHQFWLEHISGKMWNLLTSGHWLYLLED